MVGDADYGAWRGVGRRDNIGTVDPDVAGFQAGCAAGREFDGGDLGLCLRWGHGDMVMPGGGEARVAGKSCCCVRVSQSPPEQLPLRGEKA